MNTFAPGENDLLNDGFAIIENVYLPTEIDAIISLIDDADQSNTTFRKSDDLFAIRQFFKELPHLKSLVLTDKLKFIINDLFGPEYFVVKSIYFDKPEKSNWFVLWHQDLTISVDKKSEIDGYTNWTTKQNQFAVQPPLNILQDNFTVRIHLDDTDSGNGALKIIRGSHLKNIYGLEDIDMEKEIICEVKTGEVMIMRPLLMHASNRTTTNRKRRVIHIEFSRSVLPGQINWAEK